MPVRVVTDSCADSTSAGNCKLAPAANISAAHTYPGVNYYTDCGTKQNGPAFPVPVGQAIQQVFVWLHRTGTNAAHTFTVTLEENVGGSWTTRATTGALNIDATLTTNGTHGILLAFQAPHTATAHQYRITVQSSAASHLSWWRDGAANNYTYACVTDGDDASGVSDGDTLILAQGITFSQDQARTYAPTNGRSIVIGTGATYSVPNPGAPLNIGLGAGNVLMGHASYVEIGSAIAEITNRVNIDISVALGGFVFHMPDYVYGAPVLSSHIKVYGRKSTALRRLVDAAVAAQNVVTFPADLPAAWVNGDEVKFVAKNTHLPDAQTYFIRVDGPRQASLFTSAALDVQKNLDVDLVAGGACVSLSEADRTLGVKVNSTNNIHFMSVSYVGQATYVVQGVYLYRASLSFADARSASPTVESVVSYLTSGTEWMRVQASLLGGSLRNAHLVATVSGTTPGTISGYGWRVENVTLQNHGATLTTGSPMTDSAGDVWSDVVLGQMGSSNSYYVVLTGSGHAFTDVTIVGCQVIIGCHKSTFTRVKQQASWGTGAYMNGGLENTFVDCQLGAGTGNLAADVSFKAQALTTAVLRNSVLGGRGIDASYKGQLDGSYMQWHNFGGVLGDHRTWKPRATFTTDAPNFANLVQAQRSATEVSEHVFELLSEAIAGSTFTLVVDCLVAANYDDGAAFTLPHADVYFDDHDPAGTPDATVSAPAADGASHTLSVSFTPAQSNRKISVVFRAKTDQDGATVSWSNARIEQRIFGKVYATRSLAISETLTYPIATVATPAVNPFVTLTQEQAGALAGIAYDPVARRITQTVSHTVSEVYQWFQEWAAQPGNVVYDLPFDTVDGSNFDCDADYVLDGCTLSGSGTQKVIQLGAHTYTRQNGGLTDGVTFVDALGTHVMLSAPNLIDGTRVRVYNVTQAVEIDNSVVAGGAGYQRDVTLPDANIAIGNFIALYATYASGLVAKKELYALGVMTGNGLSFIDAQEAWPEYAGWGIDGSTVNEFIADYPNVQIDLSDPDGATTRQRLMAWWVYNLTTADGIRNYFGGITVEDASNYRVNVGVVGLLLDNVSAVAVRFTDAARLYRSDGSTIIAAGSGSIQSDSGKVYNTSAPAPSAAEVAAASAASVWAAGSRTLTSPALSAAAIAAAVLGGDWAGVAPVADKSLVNVLRGLGTRHKIAWNEGTQRFDVYREDGVTVAYSIAPTLNATARPIVGVTPA